MKCVRFFGFMLFALLASCAFTSLYTADTYAVEDMTVTYQTNPGDWVDVFPDCLESCLDQYHFLKIESSGSYGYASLRIRYDGSAITSLMYQTGTTSYIGLPFDGHNLNLLMFAGGSYGYPYTFTLMDSISSGITPSGTLNIAENGSYDVTQYAQVDVNIQQEVVYQDYHEDLVNINHSIIICAATILVLYFFYCIYRMIIKGAGVK